MVRQNGRELWLVKILFSIPLAGTQPDIAFKDLQEIFRPLFIQQFCFRLPIEPADIKWTVAIPHDILFKQTALAQLVPDQLGLEPGGILHHARSNPFHFLVADFGVKVFLQPFEQGIIYPHLPARRPGWFSRRETKRATVRGAAAI